MEKSRIQIVCDFLSVPIDEITFSNTDDEWDFADTEYQCYHKTNRYTVITEKELLDMIQKNIVSSFHLPFSSFLKEDIAATFDISKEELEKRFIPLVMLHGIDYNSVSMKDEIDVEMLKKYLGFYFEDEAMGIYKFVENYTTLILWKIKNNINNHNWFFGNMIGMKSEFMIFRSYFIKNKKFFDKDWL